MRAEAKPFNIKLTEDERAKLEEHRRALGLKSQADVVRLWIDGPITRAVDVADALGLPSLHIHSLDQVADQVAEAIQKRLAIDVKQSADAGPKVQVGPSTSTPGSRLKKR